MNETIKRHLISAIHTFITVFIVSFGTLVSTIDITSGSAILAAWISAGTTAVRASTKILIESLK